MSEKRRFLLWSFSQGTFLIRSSGCTPAQDDFGACPLEVVQLHEDKFKHNRLPHRREFIKLESLYGWERTWENGLNKLTLIKKKRAREFLAAKRGNIPYKLIYKIIVIRV
ncbi:hypothetical protein LX32DRAFT_649172 [Colletotrichum zoysiae]|uniref:Uncharacterized protein n=1 Tax=Colletotrichum zoysiae TaxID=1216348 RepID=A0AAD9M8H8_9PEZI|nr:hypothetical protein LX32DRAFT_649172 [Colletotrichum zoysiae]